MSVRLSARALQERADLRAVAVTIDSIINPVFGTPVGTGVAATGGMATPTPTPKCSEGRISLMLVDQNESARICKALNPADGGDAAKSR